MFVWKEIGIFKISKKIMEEDVNEPKEEINSLEDQAEAKEENKQNRKIDISLTLSIIALIITALQFIVSTPFFTEYYYKASFEIAQSEPMFSKNGVTNMFTIINPSKNTVENIEIGIEMLAGDTIRTMPNQNIEFSFKKNSNTKDCFFKIEKLVPDEYVILLIHSNLDSLMLYNRDILEIETELGVSLSKINPSNSNRKKEKYLYFPHISVAKFDKGSAKIIRYPINQRIKKIIEKDSCILKSYDFR